MIVIDFLTSSLIGRNPPKIVRAAARRLNTMIPGVEAKYVHMLEALMEHHKIVHKVKRLLCEVQSEAEVKRGLDALAAEMSQYQYMCVAEKKCLRRRGKSGQITFSSQAFKRIRRAQINRSLLRLHAGKIRNIENLKRAARRCGIEKPMKKSLAEIRAKLKACKKSATTSRSTATNTDTSTSGSNWNGPGREEARRQRHAFCA